MAKYFVAGTNKYGGRGIVRIKEDDKTYTTVAVPGEQAIKIETKNKDKSKGASIVFPRPDETPGKKLDFGKCQGDMNVRSTVYAGFSEEERAKLLVQYCTLAGAAEIRFFPCDRSKKKLSAAKRVLPILRLLADEAARESGKKQAPVIGICEDFTEMLDAAIKKDAVFFMHELGEDRALLADAISKSGDLQTAAVIIGPERGFTEAEVKSASAIGFNVCSLGDEVLRSEDAAATAVIELRLSTERLLTE